jgi:hypothetical protein
LIANTFRPFSTANLLLYLLLLSVLNKKEDKDSLKPRPENNLKSTNGKPIKENQLTVLKGMVIT